MHTSPGTGDSPGSPQQQQQQQQQDDGALRYTVQYMDPALAARAAAARREDGSLPNMADILLQCAGGQGKGAGGSG